MLTLDPKEFEEAVFAFHRSLSKARDAYGLLVYCGATPRDIAWALLGAATAVLKTDVACPGLLGVPIALPLGRAESDDLAATKGESLPQTRPTGGFI